jgi:type II restriction/modification system DNA methylase subunit YeeA
MDIVRRYSDTWIIDFGIDMLEEEAVLYEAPFQYVLMHVQPSRMNKRDSKARTRWWLHQGSRAEMRAALKHLTRFIATSRVAKYRLFIWLPTKVLPDSRVYAVARNDNATFGVLHSKVHELWSLATCSWHGVGNDPTYNAASCFETFPFPTGLLHSPDPDGQFPAIAQAAIRLNQLREAWCNPPEWVDLVPEIVPGYPLRVIPKAEHVAELKQRTLTALYNQRPAWLIAAHRVLDETVALAYGWPVDLADEEILQHLLALNHHRT